MIYPNQNYCQQYSYNPTPYQVPNYQQPQQMMLANVKGRVIQSVDEITANDVPMDGSNAIFPYADGSRIIVKHWNGNGSISTQEFEPKIEQKIVEPNNSTIKVEKDVFDDFACALQRIEEQISKLVPQQKRTTKKDGETE